MVAQQALNNQKVLCTLLLRCLPPNPKIDAPKLVVFWNIEQFIFN